MTQLAEKRRIRRNPVQTERSISVEEQQRRQLETQELDRRGSQYFEPIRTRLLKTHYNWYIAIEVESGYYLLDSNWENLIRRVNIYCPKGKLIMYGLNETGTCGQI